MIQHLAHPLRSHLGRTVGLFGLFRWFRSDLYWSIPALTALLLLILIGPPVAAQPIGKPVRIVLGFAPGAVADTVARVVAERIRGSYAPVVLVDNRPGAAGRTAVELMKSAEPDGSQILFSPSGMLVVAPHLMRRLPYDPLNDFMPVMGAARTTFALTIGPLAPSSVRSLTDLARWARENPKLASFGAPGPGSGPQFLGLSLLRELGLTLDYIPYKGMGPVTQDLLGERLAVGMLTVVDAQAQMKAGRLRVLATTGPSRSRFLPEVPTAAEAGLRGIEADEWFGLFLPVKTAPEVVERLHAALREGLNQAEVRERLAQVGAETMISPATEFRQFVRSDHERWGRLIRASGYKPED